MDLGLEARRGRPHHHGLDVLHGEHHLVREELHEGRDSGGGRGGRVCVYGGSREGVGEPRAQDTSAGEHPPAAVSGGGKAGAAARRTRRQGGSGGKAGAAARQTRRQGKRGGKVDVPCERRGRSGGARSRLGTCGCG